MLLQFLEAYEVEPMMFVFKSSNLIGRDPVRSSNPLLKLCFKVSRIKVYLRYAIFVEKGVK